MKIEFKSFEKGGSDNYKEWSFYEIKDTTWQAVKTKNSLKEFYFLAKNSIQIDFALSLLLTFVTTIPLIFAAFLFINEINNPYLDLLNIGLSIPGVYLLSKATYYLYLNFKVKDFFMGEPNLGALKKISLRKKGLKLVMALVMVTFQAIAAAILLIPQVFALEIYMVVFVLYSGLVSAGVVAGQRVAFLLTNLPFILSHIQEELENH